MSKYKIGYRDGGQWRYFVLVCEHSALMHMCITLLAEGCDKMSITKVDDDNAVQ